MIDPEKVLWAKSIVDDVLIQNPDGPEKIVHSYSLSHFPEDNNGVFIQRLSTSPLSDGEPTLELVFVKRSVLPELIKALTEYLASNS